MDAPQVIFFDAVGTLFAVRGTVGETYARLARDYGVTVDSQRLDRAFIESFRASTPPAFPDAEPSQIPQLEFEWWEAISMTTFQRIGAFEQFSNFQEFFKQLFAYFATAEPWFVYPDVPRTLERLKGSSTQFGILSNFDSRLYRVLQALDLDDFFTSITLSTEVGAAKPDRQIFEVALSKHDCQPERAWHIGDSYKEDYEGAKAAGLHAIWLDRQ
ncbi:HAD-IA family hydrolase [Oxynema sp. CENA135]|uniref:HAD-IA family hydrolase n=1 Tax=Oxynema sp. CENA135 TaxID=984206 RepID=UPI00190D7C5B|nr:HAD-IA family hydrolase [Oxynema sp. CENA135]MBK4731275.1 HAD-IA family hydrolase [Oxynema sp. CENA135]